jgi:hypothetical protein
MLLALELVRHQATPTLLRRQPKPLRDMALRNPSPWLLLATSVAAVSCGGAVSFAQTNNDEMRLRGRPGGRGWASVPPQSAYVEGNRGASPVPRRRSERGVPQDELLAFKWMKAAAEENQKNAQFNLAQMYLAGRGVTADRGQAVVWAQKAAARGHEEAAKLLVQISTSRATEPAQSNSIQPPASGGRREPTKVGATSGVVATNAVRMQGAEILEAAWRKQTRKKVDFFWRQGHGQR